LSDESDPAGADIHPCHSIRNFGFNAVVGSFLSNYSPTAAVRMVWMAPAPSAS